VAAARCGAAGFVVGQIREIARRQRHATPTLCRLATCLPLCSARRDSGLGQVRKPDRGHAEARFRRHFDTYLGVGAAKAPTVGSGFHGLHSGADRHGDQRTTITSTVSRRGKVISRRAFAAERGLEPPRLAGVASDLPLLRR
jgi:hypothetical protein